MIPDSRFFSASQRLARAEVRNRLQVHVIPFAVGQVQTLLSALQVVDHVGLGHVGELDLGWHYAN